MAAARSVSASFVFVIPLRAAHTVGLLTLKSLHRFWRVPYGMMMTLSAFSIVIVFKLIISDLLFACEQDCKRLRIAPYLASHAPEGRALRYYYTHDH